MQVALDITQRAFGDGSLLTGHRMLRLGSIRVVQGQLSEAASLLTRALKVCTWGTLFCMLLRVGAA